MTERDPHADLIARLRAQPQKSAEILHEQPETPAWPVAVTPPPVAPVAPTESVSRAAVGRQVMNAIWMLIIIAALAAAFFKEPAVEQPVVAQPATAATWKRAMLWDSWFVAQFNVIYWEKKADPVRRAAWLQLADDWKQWDGREGEIPENVSDSLYMRRAELVRAEPPVDLAAVKAARHELMLRIYGTADDATVYGANSPRWPRVVSEYDPSKPDSWRGGQK